MYKNPPKRVLLVLVALILLTHTLPQSAIAQEIADSQLSESDFFSDIPVVLTATRLKQSKKNSPVATTIIDREMIEASGFTEIADLMRLAPGMLVNYDSGHIANVGYQFLFDRYRVRFQVLVDGMSVYTPLFGEMPWTQLGITVDDIERIEVIRGPSSASYGPNAMTGVISIITKHAVLDKGMRFKANEGVNGRSEKFATIGNSNGKFDYKLSLASRKDDGFKNRYDSKDMSIANFRGDYQLTNSDNVTISANHSAGNYQEDVVDYLNPAIRDHTKKVRQSSFTTKWEHNYTDGDIFTLNYYLQTYDDSNSYISNEGGIYGDVPLNESVKTDRNNLEISYSIVSDVYNIIIGALYRKDKTRSPEYLYQVNKNIITQQAFINSELHLNKTNILNIGLLYDKNDTAETSISPRVSLNHHFNKNHTTRISYSESSRSPFILEEYTNRVVYVPDLDTSFTIWSDLSDLKAEKIKSIDIGYIGNLNGNKTNIDVRIYKNKITDLIIQKLGNPTGGGFIQGDAFNVTGFEATLSHRFKNTKLIFNYARTRIEAEELVHGTAIGYETGAPDDSGSLLIMHDFGNKVNGSLGYYYTGSYQQLCCEVQQQAIRSRVDLSLSKTFRLYGKNSKIKFVLQNATNEEVITILENNYDRQGYISFSIEL